MKIIVTLPVNEVHKDKLIKSAPNEEFLFTSADKVDIDNVQDADIIIGNLSPSYIKGSKKIKWVQLNSAGTDGYTAPGILPDGTILTNASGAYGLAISEYMVAVLLSMMKKLPLYAKDQENAIWSDHGGVDSIYGSKTLVVGAGDIGGEFAKRVHALGSTVIGIRKNVGINPDCYEAVYQMDKFKDCLQDADIVATCLPGTKETYHLFDREAFLSMKEGAYFINIGRGGAVDTDALANALNSGHLKGAAVDVTEPEPLPKDHPLWKAKNLILTPHVSGGYHLPETLERIVSISAENLKLFMEGKPLNNIVDLATGYRINK